MFQLLIVDDHPAQVEGLAHTIKSFGAIGIEGIHKAYSGYEALQLLSTETIDILITDIRMPEMSGLQLIEAVRSSSSSVAQFIILSGYADFEYAKQAIEYRITRYLMKPVDAEELRQLLTGCIEELRQERNRKQQIHRFIYTLRENYPLLRGTLLQELISGQAVPMEQLVSKLERLELAFSPGDDVTMMLVRLDNEMADIGERSELSLMEYAITNLTDDIFGEQCHLWSCKDSHGYLIYIIKAKCTPSDGIKADEAASVLYRLERLAQQLKQSVRRYLKGDVSVLLIRKRAVFPNGLPSLYRMGISAIRRAGEGRGLFITAGDEEEPVSVCELQSLYEPPLLNHLMETGKWLLVEQRIGLIFQELAGKWRHSPETLNEAFHYFAGAFNYISHRNGRQLSDLIGQVNLTNPCLTLHGLEGWVQKVLDILRSGLSLHGEERGYAIRRAAQYIEQHLDQDVSLQAIADRVGLHPVYLSKLFKHETGIGLGDYVMKCRMEKAASLLRDNKLKVYHIAHMLGYQTSHYFIKVFKKYYGLTPQEYKAVHS